MRKKISINILDILLIFCVFICIESISIATYETAVLGEKEEKRNRTISKQIAEEQMANLSEQEQEVLSLVNEYRLQNGLNKLEPLAEIQNVAKLKAEDLVENNYFSHTSERLGTPFEMLRNNRIDYSIAGENLAGNISAKKAVNAWINSKSHRENILEKKYEYTGIYIIESPIYGNIYVQIFIGI